MSRPLNTWHLPEDLCEVVAAAGCPGLSRDQWGRALSPTPEDAPGVAAALEAVLGGDLDPSARARLTLIHEIVSRPLPPASVPSWCRACRVCGPHTFQRAYPWGAEYACDACGVTSSTRREDWAWSPGAEAVAPVQPAPRRGGAPRPARAERRTKRPDAPTPAPAARYLLVGCGKDKAPAPRPAAALYTGGLTVARIRYAQASGRPWAILSALHGLLRPEEEVVPYDRALSDLDTDGRAAWGREVAVQVARWLGEVGAQPGATVEIHAGADYARALMGELRALGLSVELPTKGLPVGAQKAWYARARDSAQAAVAPAAQPDLFAARPAAQWSPLGLEYAAREWHRYPNGATACAVGWGWSLGEGARRELARHLTPEEVEALEGCGTVAPGCELLRLHRVSP